MTNKVLILLLNLFLVFKSTGQVDTSFWFVAPDISAQMGEVPVVLHILTYDQASAVNILQPALTGTAAINTSVSIPAASIFTLDLSPFVSSGALESAPVNSVSSKGIYISSKEFISVYYTIGAGSNKEMITLKGRHALGTDFYACLPSSNVVRTHSVTDGGIGIDIVATQTGTTLVLITPRAHCVGRTKNVTFSRLLTQGQTFSLLDTGTVIASELAGSIISSDQEICVTVKGSIANGSTLCPSYFSDQITPSSLLGRDYVVRRGSGQLDIAYILAPQNASSYTISSQSATYSGVINATETFSINNTDEITYIRSDKPIYVFHLSGFGCKLSGAQLAPVFCAGSYSSTFCRLSTDSLYLNIVTRAGNQNSFSLTSNGSQVNIPANSFSAVPGSAGVLVSARVFMSSSSIPIGSYNQLINSTDLFGLTIHNGGTTGGSAYAHASNFKTTSFVRANIVPTATTCANTQFALNGLIGGGPNTGVWTLINGFGTFLNGAANYSSNVYIPNTLDTTNNNLSIPVTNRFVKIILTTTGICDNVSDTLRLHVLQPPIIVAGTNSVICGNYKNIQLAGDVYGATNTGVWNLLSPASGTFVLGANTFTPVYQFSSNDTAQTSIRFSLTSTNNGQCNAEGDTITVFITKPPIVDAGSASPAIRCSNNSTVVLNGSVSGTTSSTGIWATSGSGLFTPNNLALNASYIPSVSDIASNGIWLVLESTNNGLCLPTRDSILLQFIEPSVVNAGSDVNTCINNPQAVLNGVITGTVASGVNWLGGAGTFSPNNSALTVTYTGTPAEIAAGFLTLTLTTVNSGLCFGTEDEVRINFQPKPIANFSVNPVCLGQITEFKDRSLNFSQTGVITDWQWSFGDNAATSNLINPFYQYNNVGNYTAQLVVRNSFNCFDTIQKSVLINALPTASFQLTRDCSGAAQLIHFADKSQIAAPDSILESGQYWDFGGFGFSFAKDTSIIFPSEGLYTISHVITSNKGCQAVIVRTVEITPRPNARFIYLNNAIQGIGADVVFRDTSTSAVNWLWDFGNGETSEERHPVTAYSQNGTFTVNLTVNDVFGCPSSYSLEIKISTIVSDIVKLIPNVITPNGDGKNDQWRLDFIDVFFPNAEIDIYNRWGQKIFHSNGYSNAWDGSYKGDPLPVGAYFYIINLNDSETPIIKGSVTLIK